MRRPKLALLLAGSAALLPGSVIFAQTGTQPAAQLIVKPLLCVLDRPATSCAMTFDIRWRSVLAAAYCLHDSAQPEPLQCWASALTGAFTRQREVSEDFSFSLRIPGGDAVTEVKISVLRVDSNDRRRERRSRHVWDVL
jgi:hypothetical protein